MHRGLRRRQAEDHPAAADVDRAEFEHVAEERAIGLGILAVEQDVSALEHRHA